MNAEATVSTLLIQGNRLFREGLRHILADTPYKIQNETDSLDAADKLISNGLSPGLLLLDFNHNDENDLQLIRKLHTHLQRSSIIVLTSTISASKLAKALDAGCDAYLLKDMSPDALIQSINLVMLGEKVFPTNLAHVLIDGEIHHEGNSLSQLPSGLSEREMQILRCLVSGAPNKIIAHRLKITESTVKVHLKGILRKIQVSNRTQAAIWAVAKGITEHPFDPSRIVSSEPSADLVAFGAKQ